MVHDFNNLFVCIVCSFNHKWQCICALTLNTYASRCVCCCNWCYMGWCRHMRCSWSVRETYHRGCMLKTNIEIIQVHITSFNLLCIMLLWSWMFIAHEVFHERWQLYGILIFLHLWIQYWCSVVGITFSLQVPHMNWCKYDMLPLKFIYCFIVLFVE